MRNYSLPQSEQEAMLKVQYHKGSFCINGSYFCQEGYCSECEIYKRGILAAKTSDLQSRLANAQKLQESASTRHYR